MIAEVTLSRSDAAVSGEDPDVSGDRSKDENDKGKGKRVDVLADYSETRGGKSSPALSEVLSAKPLNYLQHSEFGDYNPSSPARVRIIQRINHLNEVNRARYMPQNPNLIATKTVSGDVYVFDRTKHSSEPGTDGICRPDFKLKGQKKEGWVSPIPKIDERTG
jgi:hypothetical protein